MRHTCLLIVLLTVPTAASGAAPPPSRVHVLVVADGEAPAAAANGVVSDGQRMAAAFETLAKTPGLADAVRVRRLTGVSATPAAVLDAIDALATRPEDAVVVYYAGATSTGPASPDLVFRHNRTLTRADLRGALAAKGVRLAAILVDGRGSMVPLKIDPKVAEPVGVDPGNFAELFVKASGLVEVDAAAVGSEGVGDPDQGGLLSVALRRALARPAAPLAPGGQPSHSVWDEFWATVLREAEGLAKVAGVAQQPVARSLPVSEVDVTRVVRVTNASALKLLQATTPTGQNTVVSPVGLLQCAGLVAEAAGGTTRAQLVASLDLGEPLLLFHRTQAQLVGYELAAPAPGPAVSVPTGPDKLWDEFGVLIYDGQGKLIVTAVRAKSPAAVAGITPGDELLRVGGEEVNTASQLQDRLRPPLSALRLDIHRQLRGQPLKPSRFEAVNLGRVQQGMDIKPGFRKASSDFYHAEFREIDFASPLAANEATRWFGPELPAPAGTRLVLANVLRFEAAWGQPFPKPREIDRGAFEVQPDANVVVQYMKHQMRVRSVEDDQAGKLLELPYAGGRYSFVAILPPGGVRLADFEAGLTTAKIESWVRKLRSVEIEECSVALPKIHIATRTDCRAVVNVPEVFDSGKANFTNLTTTPGVAVSRWVQDAEFSVDELGTRAGATTRVILGAGKEFSANRPFLFAVVEQRRGLILFLGRFTHP